MQTVDHPRMSSPRDDGSLPLGPRHGRRYLFGGWRGLLSVTIVAAAVAAFAVSQNWVAFATLLPLLYVLPCAAMLYVCMKGKNH